MTVSTVSAARREQQEEQIQRFIAFSLLGSALVHLVLLPFAMNLIMTQAPEMAEEPIEFIVLEEPEPEAPEPEPEPEEEPEPTPEPVEPEAPEPEPEPEPTPEPEMVEEMPEPEPLEMPEPEPIPEPEMAEMPEPEPIPEPEMAEMPEPEPLAPQQNVEPPNLERILNDPVSPEPEPLAPQEAPPPIPSTDAPPLAETAPLDPVENQEIAQQPWNDDTFESPPPLDPVEQLPEPPVASRVPETTVPESDWMNELPPNDDAIALEQEAIASENLDENLPAISEPLNEPSISEPPVTSSVPETSSDSSDFVSEFPTADSAPTEEATTPSERPLWNGESDYIPEEPLDMDSPPSPAIASNPVTNSRPGTSDNSGFLSDLETSNPTPRVGESSTTAPSNWNSSSDYGIDEPLNSNAGNAPPRVSESAVANSRPGSGENSSEFFNDLETGASSSPSAIGSNSNSPSSWSGDSGYSSASEPFGSNSGPMDPGSNPGSRGGSPNGSPSGSPGGSGSVGCRRCGKPNYPRVARDRGLEGVVLLSVDIDPDGNVTDVRLQQSSGYDVLDESAIDKAWSWKFDRSDSGQQGQIVSIPFRLEDS